MQELMNALTAQKARRGGSASWSPIDLIEGPNDAWFSFGDFSKAWQDGAETVPAAADQPVASIVSQGGTLKAGQAGAARPLARDVGGQRSVFWTPPQSLVLPAGLTLDRRDCTIFHVFRTRTQATMALWHMPRAGGSELALYLNATVNGANTLRLFNGNGAQESGIDASHGIGCAVLVCGPSGIRLYYGQETFDFAAAPAGSIAGGLIGDWNGGAFPLLGHGFDAGCLARAIGEPDIFRLIDYFSAERGALSRNAESVIVAFGDSTREGVTAAGNATANDYSSLAQMARLCASEPKYVNLGAGGLRAELAATGPSIAQLNANAAYADRVFLLGPLGTNDIYSWSRTGPQVIGDLTRIVNEVKAGVTGAAPIVAGATILPRGGAAQAEVDAVNDWMRSSPLFDLVIDYDGDARLADPGDASVYGDGVHPTHLGYSYMAEVELAVLRPLGLVS